MNSKRSYLDTLNAGRQRRPHTSLEQLNRSLESLEQRLERPRAEASGWSGSDRLSSAEPRYARANPYGQHVGDAGRWQSQGRPGGQEGMRTDGPPYGYQTIARDIERVRGQEESLAVVGKIAEELRSLRNELRQQMSVGLQREFEALREDIERAFRSGPATRSAAELEREFERLSGAIQALAERSDDRGIALLRLDLEQMKAALDTLAREESVQKADSRWDDFYRRWDAFENRIDADSQRRAEGPALSMLFDRLEQIGQAIENLPESLSLRSLEEKVRTLAAAIDRFAAQKGSGSDILGLIDERLDEISRAIVASTVAAKSNMLDPATMERIEQRIASLAEQIEEVAESRSGSELLDRLNQLSSRVDDLAARAQLPEQAIDRLAEQISTITERIERAPAMPDAGELINGIEQRFDLLANMIERRQGEAIEHGNALFHDLERRLDEMADRLDRQSGEAFDSAGIMEAIDARFTALAERLETRHSPGADQVAMRGLESRLEDISSRLDASAAQMAGIDPNLIRSLEAQVASLSAHLSKPDAPLPAFEDIGPRITRIEQAVAESRDTILEAAREAAENAVRALGAASPDTAAVAGLAQDLKTLEALTRRSDERNAKTFEAIHDTLLKIVDRLSSLEKARELPGKIAIHDAPALDLDEPMPLDEPDGYPAMGRRDTVEAPQARTPAEAAADAARAALGGEIVAEKTEGKRRRSMLGGLARALSRKEPETATAAAASPAPEVALDEPLEPKLVNRPLEPGSGAPDLNAIIRRVRDERAQPAKDDSDAAKADFIAAARRAAQAAAAEADALKRQSTLPGPVKALRIGDLIRAKRKPILMAAAAIMLALAGLQLGKAFLSDPQRVAGLEPEPAAVEQSAQPSAIETTSAMEGEATASEQATADPLPAARMVGQDISDDDAGQDLAAVDSPPASSSLTGPAGTDEGASGAETAVTESDPQSVASVSPVSEPAYLPELDAAEIPSDIGPAALREAAAKGDARALFEIGSRYAEGRGVKEDMAAAAKWYEKAAEGGLAVAQYRIGNFYEKGIGVERDIEKSKTWYRRAAEQGNASAMHNLAVLFAMAADGEADNESAAHWFQEAADLGVKDSQFNLGILAAKGVGMPQNLEESYKWFSLVAKAGDKDAATKRDEIAKALRPEQLERARAAATLWKARPLNEAANSVDIPEAWQDAPMTTASIDMKKAVQNIQRILNKNGYDAGSADGIMGERTKNAIKAFQADNGLEPTGEVDEKLVQALLARK